MEAKLKAFEKTYQRKVANFTVGDTVAVHTIIREGDKKRIQIFKGLVISIANKGISKSFTVRKISYGVGVEKIFPMHSTNIEKIELLKQGEVRRAKLFYLRDRVGKAALKVKPGKPIILNEGVDDSATAEIMPEQVVEAVEVAETEAAA